MREVDGPSRKVEEGQASSDLSERVARTKIDTSLSIIGRNLLKTSSLDVVPALESVTGANREASTGLEVGLFLYRPILEKILEKIDLSRGKFRFVIDTDQFSRDPSSTRETTFYSSLRRNETPRAQFPFNNFRNLIKISYLEREILEKL